MKNQYIIEAYEIIKEEAEELKRDHQMDDLSIGDVSMLHAQNRAKWAARKHMHLCAFTDAEWQHDKFLEDTIDAMQEEGKLRGNPTKSRVGCERAIKKTDKYFAIQGRMKKLKLINEWYHDSLASVFKIQWDISNNFKRIAMDEGGM
jgi:hypothetical protein